MIGINIEDLTGKSHIFMFMLKIMNVIRLPNPRLINYLYAIVLLTILVKIRKPLKKHLKGYMSVTYMN